jgi:hypothetical protein
MILFSHLANSSVSISFECDDDTPANRGFCGGWMMMMMDPSENRRCVVCVLKLEKANPTWI